MIDITFVKKNVTYISLMYKAADPLSMYLMYDRLRNVRFQSRR